MVHSHPERGNEIRGNGKGQTPIGYTGSWAGHGFGEGCLPSFAWAPVWGSLELTA